MKRLGARWCVALQSVRRVALQSVRPSVLRRALRSVLQSVLRRALRHGLRSVLQSVLRRALRSALQSVLRHALRHGLQSALRHGLRGGLGGALRDGVRCDDASCDGLLAALHRDRPVGPRRPLISDAKRPRGPSPGARLPSSFCASP